MTVQQSKTVRRTKAKVYRCARCDRKLPVRHDGPRWVFSKFTKKRYCPPGRGCAK